MLDWYNSNHPDSHLGIPAWWMMMRVIDFVILGREPQQSPWNCDWFSTPFNFHPASCVRRHTGTTLMMGSKCVHTTLVRTLQISKRFEASFPFCCNFKGDPSWWQDIISWFTTKWMLVSSVKIIKFCLWTGSRYLYYFKSSYRCTETILYQLPFCC